MVDKNNVECAGFDMFKRLFDVFGANQLACKRAGVAKQGLYQKRLSVRIFDNQDTHILANCDEIYTTGHLKLDMTE